MSQNILHPLTLLIFSFMAVFIVIPLSTCKSGHDFPLSNQHEEEKHETEMEILHLASKSTSKYDIVQRMLEMKLCFSDDPVPHWRKILGSEAFLCVSTFSLCMCGFPPSAPTFFTSPKTCILG